MIDELDFLGELIKEVPHGIRAISTVSVENHVAGILMLVLGAWPAMRWLPVLLGICVLMTGCADRDLTTNSTTEDSTATENLCTHFLPLREFC